MSQPAGHPAYSRLTVDLPHASVPKVGKDRHSTAGLAGTKKSTLFVSSVPIHSHVGRLSGVCDAWCGTHLARLRDAAEQDQRA
jgi:hypothetical protein